MNYQIAVFSGNETFGRMLELEFLIFQKSVFRAAQTASDFYADTVLLDLDTCVIPSPQCFRRIIGFTGDSTLIGEETLRQCSMILHRPFEMRLLRQEVLAEGEPLQYVPPTDVDRRLQVKLQNELLSINGTELALTPNEARVMRLLMEHRGQAVSREEISEEIGASAANKTEVYICYLRRKIEEKTGMRLIETVRAKGYRMT